MSTATTLAMVVFHRTWRFGRPRGGLRLRNMDLSARRTVLRLHGERTARCAEATARLLGDVTRGVAVGDLMRVRVVVVCVGMLSSACSPDGKKKSECARRSPPSRQIVGAVQ